MILSCQSEYYNHVGPYGHLVLMIIREIFGPVLPLVPVDSLDDGIAYVNSQSVLSSSSKVCRRLTSGPVTIHLHSMSSLRTLPTKLKVLPLL